MEGWERKRSIGRFRPFYRRRSRRTLQNIMHCLRSKYFLFTVLGCTPGTKKVCYGWPNRPGKILYVCVGSDLAAERTNVSLKPTEITEENQTCLSGTQRLLSQYRCHFMCLATSYKQGTFCTAERRELGSCFATCLLTHVQRGPIVVSGMDAEQNTLL